MKFHFFKTTIFLTFLISLNSFAQLNFEWANKIKSAHGANDFASSVTADAAGNSIVAGSYQGTIDLNYSTANFTISSLGNNDIYLAKYDSLGNFVWGKTFGGALKDRAYTVETDAQGNIYLSGSCSRDCDFNGSNANTYLPSYAALNDSLIFLAKYDNQGNLIWVKGISGSGYGHGRNIKIAANGDVLLCGNFYGSIDFDPSAAATLLSSSNITESDIFIARYTSNGDLLWVKQIGGNENDEVHGLAMDANENYYLTGFFRSTVDFDPGSGISSLTAPTNIQSFYLAKYDVNGTLIWLNYGNNPLSASGNDIAISPTGALYVVGHFLGGLTVANAGSTITLAGISNVRTFVLKFTSSDTIIWGKALTGHGNYSIATSLTNAVYISGSETNSLLKYIRLTKLDSLGTISWQQVLGMNSYVNEGADVCVSAQGKVIHVGYFQNTVDFNPSSLQTNNLRSKYLNTSFIASYDESNSYNYALSTKDDSTANFSVPDILERDASGNVYISGQHQGNIGTDPLLDTLGTTVVPYGYTGFYITKYGTNKTQKWSIDIGGNGNCRSRSLTTDEDGNVYVCGNFYLNRDFDPSSNSTNSIGTSGTDIFIAKYDSSGNFIWLNILPSSIAAAGLTSSPMKIVYRNGKLYVLGLFYGVVDFDPSNSLYQLNSSPLQSTQFFACYSSLNGSFIYAKKWSAQSNSTNLFNDFALTKSGKIMITGTFHNSIDFDLSTSTAILAAGNGNTAAFVACYDSLLNYNWAVKAVTSGNFSCERIQLDAIGNSYIAGTFSSQASFYSIIGTFSTTGAVGNNTYLFLAKYDSLGTNLISNSSLLWPGSISSSATSKFEDMVIDKNANVYLCGKLQGSVDFDMGSTSYTLTPSSSLESDSYIACYNKFGYLMYAKSNGNVGEETNYKMAAFDTCLYVFSNSSENTALNANFNGNTNYVAGNNLIKYGLSCFDSSHVITVTSGEICGQGAMNLTVNVASGTVDWFSTPTSLTSIYTGPVYTTPVLSNSETYYVSVNPNVCSVSRIAVTATVTSPPNTSVTQASNVLTAAASGMNYQWLDCSNFSVLSGATSSSYTATANGSYAVIISDHACIDTSACYSVINIAVETLNPDASQLKIYPNPFSAELLLQSGSDLKNTLFTISDCSGRIVFTGKISTETEKLNLHFLSPGIYFLGLKNESINQNFKLFKN